MSSSTVLIATPYGFNGNIVLPWNTGGNFKNQIHNLRQTLYSEDCSREAEKVTSNVLTALEEHEISLNEIEKKHPEKNLHYGSTVDIEEEENLGLEYTHETVNSEDEDDEYEDIDEEDNENEKTPKMSVHVRRLIAERKSSLSKISRVFDSKHKFTSINPPENQTSSKNRRPSISSPPLLTNSSKNNQNKIPPKQSSSKNKAKSASSSTVEKRPSKNAPPPAKQTSNIKKYSASSPSADKSAPTQNQSSPAKQTNNIKKVSVSSPSANRSPPTQNQSSPAKQTSNIKKVSASSPRADGSSPNQTGSSLVKPTSNVKKASESPPSAEGNRHPQNLSSPAKQTNNIKKPSVPTPLVSESGHTHNLTSPVKQISNIQKSSESSSITTGSRPTQSVSSPAKQNVITNNRSSASGDENERSQKVVTPVKQTSPNNVKRPSSSSPSPEANSLKLANLQGSISEKLLKIRFIVERAIRDHKIFCMYACYPTIREALKQRGWIEKDKESCMKKPSTSQSALGAPQDDSARLNTTSSSTTMLNGQPRSIEAMLKYRLLRQVKPDFVWAVRSDPINWEEVTKKQLINRFPRAYFTTKVGLCNYLKSMHWYCEEGVSRTLFPRCYNICHSDEMSAFREDFRLTACIGLLKWLIFTYLTKGESAIKSNEGQVPHTAIEFAIARCSEYVVSKNHEDIDKSDPIVGIWDHQWDQFLTWYYMVLHKNILFTEFQKPTVQSLYEAARTVTAHMKKFWPQYDLDGMHNIWIVKPGAKSRGRGIQLMNKLEKIMEKVNPAIMKESRYVVQKYIERPLLIYDTKFDIRQWFLVTSAQPLTIWMYKECYLRFCSQTFSLTSFHESIHLCNNAVQRNYKNGTRDPALPDENMWDCYTFQTYLRAMGHADMWEKCIYPGMRQSIICALLSAQEHMDRRRNCFELYGADFMLTEDFNPWLIEINSCPCMAASTSITARMCAQCLEDVIKVVVDRRDNSSASTGMFELVYRQRVPKAPPYLGMNLSVKGTKIFKNCVLPKPKTGSPRESPSPTASPSTINSQTSSSHESSASRNIIKESPPAKRPVPPSSAKGSPEVKSPKVRSPIIKTSTFSDNSNSTSKNHRHTKRKSEFTGPVIVDMLSNLDSQLGRKKKKPHACKRRITRKVSTVHVITEKDIAEAELKICRDPKFLIGEKLLEKAFGEKVPLVMEKNEVPSELDTEEEEEEEDYVHSECSKEKNAKMMDQPSTQKVDDNKNANKKELLNMEELEIKKKQMCVMWKNSSDAERSIQLFNEWKQKLDHTRASCEDMLYKLKMFRENENLKPKYYSINKGINWEDENANKPTISDILQKLSQAHPEREVFVFKNSQQLAELESHQLKRKPRYFNMLIDDDTQHASRQTEKSPSDQSPFVKLPLTSQFLNPIIEKHYTSIAMRGVLPRIRQKTKFANSKYLQCNGHKLDNFYAIGMSLKRLQAIRSKKGHPVFPPQSDNTAVPPVTSFSVDG